MTKSTCTPLGVASQQAEIGIVDITRNAGALVVRFVGSRSIERDEEGK